MCVAEREYLYILTPGLENGPREMAWLISEGDAGCVTVLPQENCVPSKRTVSNGGQIQVGVSPLNGDVPSTSSSPKLRGHQMHVRS